MLGIKGKSNSNRMSDGEKRRHLHKKEKEKWDNAEAKKKAGLKGTRRLLCYDNLYRTQHAPKRTAENVTGSKQENKPTHACLCTHTRTFTHTRTTQAAQQTNKIIH